MKILLTGGAGFIGSHLVDRLLERGDTVTVIDDFNDYYDPAIKRANLKGKNVEIVEADIRDEKVLDGIFGAKPDVLVHLAARAGVRPSVEDPVLYSDVNVAGTLILFDLCRKHGVSRVVFGSSSSVYGNSEVPFSESRGNLHPISPYGATKLIGELYAKAYNVLYGLKITCLRFFTVYGPRQRPDMAIHKFARLIEDGKKIPLFGEGTTRRDYTYVSDIVAGILQAMDHNEEFGVYNLGESQTIELKGLIAELESALGKKASISHQPEQPGDVKQTCADVTRAREVLGYQPSVPVKEGVHKFIDWFRA